MKSNKQIFKIGSIIKIELSKRRLAFGRLLPGNASAIEVYDFIWDVKDELPPMQKIINNPVIFYCGLYRNIITKGLFEIVGYMDFSKENNDHISAFFTQDMVNIEDCTIFWPGGERKATPQECTNLERSSVWEAEGIKQRIEDYYANKKNFHVEYQRVILSKNDPRYLPPPNALRWDFEKEVFYRIDK